MFRLLPRLPRILLASTFAASGVAFAAPPAAPAPVPVPYPNTASQDAAGGSAAGKRMHKPYSASTSSAGAASGQSVSCASANARPVNGAASDPEEGGQIAKAGKTSGKADLHSFNITHKMDTSSPVLMDNAAHDQGCR